MVITLSLGLLILRLVCGLTMAALGGRCLLEGICYKKTARKSLAALP